MVIHGGLRGAMGPVSSAASTIKLPQVLCQALAACWTLHCDWVCWLNM